MMGSLFVRALGPAPTVGTASNTVLWITTIIMIVAAIIFAAMTRNAPPRARHFYYASTFIVLWAATLYFSQASGYGYVTQAGGHAFFYARYIDWLVTTPLLLLALALLALPRGTPGRTALTATLIGADVYMILTGFAAAFIRTGFRWAFFGMSCVGFLVVLSIIVAKLTPEATRRPVEVKQHYARLSPMLMGLWLLYPIVWVFSPTGWGVFPEFVSILLFAILDVLSKVGFSAVLLSDPAALTLAETQTVESAGTSHAAAPY